MINTLARLLSAASTSQIDVLSRQVAEMCVEEVCQLVGGRIEFMTFSEARGYVRARAAQLVRKHAKLELQRLPGANPAQLNAVARAATERLVPMVIRQVGVGVPKASAAKLRLAA